VAGILNNMIKQKNRGRSGELESILDRLDSLEDMEDRIRVLETVITDQNYELKKQFQELEDK